MIEPTPLDIDRRVRVKKVEGLLFAGRVGKIVAQTRPNTTFPIRVRFNDDPLDEAPFAEYELELAE